MKYYSLLVIMSIIFTGCQSSEKEDNTTGINVLDTGIGYESTSSSYLYGLYNAVGTNNYYALPSPCKLSPYDQSGQITIYSDYSATAVFQFYGKNHSSSCKVKLMSRKASDGTYDAPRIALDRNYYRKDDSPYGFYLEDVNRTGTLKITEVINDGQTAVLIDTETQTESYARIISAYYKFL